MKSQFGITYTVTIEEELRNKTHVIDAKRYYSERYLEEGIKKLQAQETRPHIVIVREWKQEKRQLETVYYKCGYLAFTDAGYVRTSDEYLWYPSDAPVGCQTMFYGRMFERIGQDEPIWVLVSGEMESNHH